MKQIPLTRGYHAKVDDSDYEWLNKHKWYVKQSRHTFYAVREVYMTKRKRKVERMHRLILGLYPSDNRLCDHRDGNGLNNVQSNLRVCTATQNCQSQKKWAIGTSKYKGVSWHCREGVDSAKWYITFPSGSAWGGTPAGAVRTDCGRYDTTFTGLSNDTALFFTLKLWDGGSDSASTWIFYWPILYSGTGSGDNAVRYYAVDTSGTDEVVPHVRLTMKTIGGVLDAIGTTNISGYWDFTAPTANMVTYGNKLGYFFKYDTTNFIGDSTDTVIGYNIPLQASPDPNLCRVQGYVFVPGGAPERTIKVTFTIVGEAVHNDCDGTAFIAEPVIAWTSLHDDSLGFFYKDLVPSGCLLKANGDSLQYNITTDLRSVTGKETLIWVPQAESYEVDW